MGLFRSKEEKAIMGLYRLRQSFTGQYVGTMKQFVAAFQQLGLTDEMLNNQDVQDGLYILHDTIIVLSQTALKNQVKEDAAADLLFFVEEARAGDSKLSPTEHRDAVIATYKVYMQALKKVHANNDGMVVPILSALKSIEPLVDFYTAENGLDVMMQLPMIEQDILISYKQWWTKNL